MAYKDLALSFSKSLAYNPTIIKRSDATGNYYVGERTNSTDGSESFFIHKYNSAGTEDATYLSNQEGGFTLTGTSYYAMCEAMSILPSDNIMIGGYFDVFKATTGDTRVYHIASLDPNGNFNYTFLTNWITGGGTPSDTNEVYNISEYIEYTGSTLWYKEVVWIGRNHILGWSENTVVADPASGSFGHQYNGVQSINVGNRTTQNTVGIGDKTVMTRQTNTIRSTHTDWYFINDTTYTGHTVSPAYSDNIWSVSDADNHMYIVGNFNYQHSGMWGGTAYNLIKLNENGTLNTDFYPWKGNGDFGNYGTNYSYYRNGMGMLPEGDLILGGDSGGGLVWTDGTTGEAVEFLHQEEVSNVQNLVVQSGATYPLITLVGDNKLVQYYFLSDAAPPVAPSGLTDSSVDYTGFKLSWVNNNVTGVTANTVQYFTTVWNTFDVVASGDTQIEFTGMTPNYSYPVRVGASGAVGTTYSESTVVDTLDPTPSMGLYGLVGDNSVQVNWSMVGDDYGTNYRFDYKYHTGSTWSEMATGATSLRTYTYPSLDYDTEYDFRVVTIGSEYPSSTVTVTTNPAPTGLFAPNSLSANTITYTGFSITWNDNNPPNPNIIYGYQIYFEGSWVTYGYVSGGTETGVFYGILPQTQYRVRVYAQQNVPLVVQYSNELLVTTQAFPEPFCSGVHYTVNNSGCGVGGSIYPSANYRIFYDFHGTDMVGDPITWNGSAFIPLPVGYFNIYATPKSGWTYHYGTAPCRVSYIALNDTSGVMELNMVVRPNPQTFLNAAGTAGRIYGDWTDTVYGTGVTHTYIIVNADTDEVILLDVNSSDINGMVAYNVPNGNYYAIVYNYTHICGALSGKFKVSNENSPFTLSGIKRIFVSEYKADLDWIQWATSDEDYYVASLDILKFQSAKIKTFTNANTWYSLPASIDTSFTQKMEKVRQGFVLSNVLTMTISPSAYSKWVATGTLLDKRWVVVFEDTNKNWWVFGYDGVGSQIKSYKRTSDLNFYSLEFTSASSDKIITGIDYDDYVLPYIINS